MNFDNEKERKLGLVIQLTIKSKEDLIKTGFIDDTNEDDSFINLMAGKTLTLREIVKKDIYTCEEYPNYAIYKDAVEKYQLPYSGSIGEELSFSKIAQNLFIYDESEQKTITYSKETIRNIYTSAINKIAVALSTYSLKAS